jgi:hypothetical protein
VKKAILLGVGFILFFSSCALFQHRGQRISWPDEITYMEAMCDLNMSWKGMKYSGAMSLIMHYPTRLQMEVYGPFGDTVMLLKKDEDDFLLATKDERFRDAGLFENRFGITIQEFMDDIVMISIKEGGKSKGFAVQRPDYRVLYTMKDKENMICWERKDGKICIRFLEVKFKEDEELLEESNNQGV